MKKILLFLFIFSLSVSFSQTFVQTYGGSGSETGSCIQKTLDGNYIIAGRTNSFSSNNLDYYLVKVDPQGNYLWSKTYGGTKNEIPYFVSTCNDGGFIMTGSRDTSANSKDLYLVRTDSDGNLLWSNTIGGTGDDLGWYVIQTSDGGFISTGNTTSPPATSTYDGYIVKVNSAGALQWTKMYDGTGATFLFSISNTNDGGYIVAGETSTNSFGSSDNLLIKLNSNGDTLWTKQIGKNTEESANEAWQTNDGGYIVVGDVHINLTVGAHHISILKTDSNGNLLWNRAYGSSPGSEIAYDVKPAPNNGYYILGETGFYGAGGKDFLLIKTDSDGVKTWAKTYGYTGTDDPWYLQEETDGSLLMTGGTISYGLGYFDFYLINADTAGNASCFDSICNPEIDFPVLQQKSGFTVLSGGTQSFPNTVVINPNTQTFNPCTLVDVGEAEKPVDPINVYPNPSSDGRFVIANIVKQSHVEVYNLWGEKIAEKTLSSKLEKLNLNEASSGIYLYKIESVNGNIATGKLIIE